MAYIILPHRWRRQPQVAVGLNPAFPWAGQVKVLLPFGGYGRALAVGNLGAPTVTTATQKVDGGIGIVSNTTGDSSTSRLEYAYGSSLEVPTKALTLLTVCRSTGSGNGTNTIFSRPLSGQYAPYGLHASSGAAGSPNGFAWWDDIVWRSSGCSTSIVGDNKVHVVAGTYDGATIKYFVDGKLDASSANTTDLRSSTGSGLYVGGYSFGGYGFNGNIGLVVVVGAAIPDSAIAEWSANPWWISRPLRRRIWVPSAGGISYTLTADAGSYAVTGSDATTKVARRLTSDAGAYTLTGSDATLKAGRVVGANAGSYTYTGSDSAFARAYAVAADAGAYTYTGSDATLTYTPSGSTYTLTADAGSYTVTGSDASTLVARKVSAEAGSYALTGSDATLTRGFVVTASAGSYTYTGSDATFSRTYALAADNGIYVLSGSDATLTYSGAPAAAPSAEQPVGGWPRRRPAIDRRVPTEEEVRRERERLGILPPRAQKVLRRIVAEISDEPELEQVAEALKPEPLAERVRKELRDSGAYFQKRNADIYPQIIAALVLDSLQRKGALDAELLAEQQEADLVNNVLLPMWLNL